MTFSEAVSESGKCSLSVSGETNLPHDYWENGRTYKDQMSKYRQRLAGLCPGISGEAC